MNSDVLVKYVRDLLPENTGDKIKDLVCEIFKSKLERVLTVEKDEAVEEFCRDRNICRVCIKGGYNCSSDHK